MTAACNLEFAGLTAKGCKYPPLNDNSSYALQISGNSNLPAYRNGDAIIVFPKATVMRGRCTSARLRHPYLQAGSWHRSIQSA